MIFYVLGFIFFIGFGSLFYQGLKVIYKKHNVETITVESKKLLNTTNLVNKLTSDYNDLLIKSSINNMSYVNSKNNINKDVKISVAKKSDSKNNGYTVQYENLNNENCNNFLIKSASLKTVEDVEIKTNGKLINKDDISSKNSVCDINNKIELIVSN